METTTAENQEIILSARELGRVVHLKDGPRTIIDSFTFDFYRGKIHTVVGPSGSGKTSLLRLFNRLDEKTGGEVLYNAHPIEGYRVTELRKKIALAFQIPYLFPGTVASNLAYCCDETFVADHDFSSRFLRQVGLDPEIADRDPEKLSVGQKQRVAFARALVQEPDILMLDEPTSSLDPGAAKVIEELIDGLNRELGLTIIMVTHNFKQAQRLGGISLLIIDGRLVEWGSSSELFTHPRSDLTRKFVAEEL